MASINLPECKVAELKHICQQHHHDAGELINVLHDAQELFGYVPAEVQEIIANELNVSLAKVYGVVTFYSFFTMQPTGEHPVSVCLGTACYVRGAEKILDEFKHQLGINVGETTADGRFSLSCLRCVGACGLAPVVMVGDRIYGRVSPERVKEIINEYVQVSVKAQ